MLVEGDDRLGPGASGGRSHPQEVPHGVPVRCRVAGDRDGERLPPRQSLGRQLHEAADVHPQGPVHPRRRGGAELERPHAADSDVAQPFDRREAPGVAALANEPLVDEEVPEPVGKRVGQEAREAVKGGMGRSGNA